LPFYVCDKLDGVLDRDNVRFIPFLVDDIDHRGQGGALSRTGWAGDEDQPAWFIEQLTNGWRQADCSSSKSLVGIWRNTIPKLPLS